MCAPCCTSTYACHVLLLLCAGQIAFVSGAAAAVGSGVVKVPIAVCIRSVQAGVYPDVFAAARSIVKAAGPRGLFTVSILVVDPARMTCVHHLLGLLAGLQSCSQHLSCASDSALVRMPVHTKQTHHLKG